MRSELSTDWVQLSALYEQAEDMSADALGQWLAQMVAQSHPLVEALQRLLRARAQLQTDDFMARTPHSAWRQNMLPAEWAQGAKVGIYRLQRPLGSGGMAEVWLADRDDGSFERQVAVKLLYRLATSAQRRTLAERFTRERNILAALNHPHIAKLLDAGITPHGQPWLALEYVQGEPITLWCDNHGVDLRSRVRLFCQVLQAVEHAHANLVLHRDLKPDNILVNAQGQVQLLDFGIAKLMEGDGSGVSETELTRVGGRALTPQYASPEQVRGEPLSTASDVYALGVVLYETLCGLLPYEIRQHTAAQIENAILEAEPRAPSRRTLLQEAAQARAVASPVALRKALDGELDAIVLKALDKRAAQRYGSAEALRLDLERWLDGAPVLARAPSTAYRLRKFVARHRLSVGVSALGIASILALAVTAVVLGVQARTESARAVAARDFLIGMFKQADPDRHQGRQMSAKELLQAGQQRLQKNMSGQALLQADLLFGLGDAQANISEYTMADATMAQAARLYEQEGRADRRCEALVEQAMVVYELGDLDRARAILQSAQPLAAGLAPAGASRFHHVSSVLALASGDLAAAHQAAQKALTLSTRAHGPMHETTVNILHALASVERRSGETFLARANLKDALNRAEQISDFEIASLIAMQSELALLEFNAGQLRDAATRLASAGARCDAAADPRGETCVGVRNIQAVTLILLGDKAGALAALPNVLEMTHNTGSPRHAAEAQLAAYRALALSDRLAEHPGLVAQVQALGDSGPEVRLAEATKVQALLAQGEMFLRRGQASQAIAVLARAESRWSADKSATRRLGARLRLAQGLAEQALGHPQAALEKLRAGADEYAALLGADHPIALIMAMNQVPMLWSVNRRAESMQMLEHALPLLRTALGETAPVYIRLRALQTEIARIPDGPDLRAPGKLDIFL